VGSDSDQQPRKVDGLTGAVTRAPFGTGSKSERMAVWIETAEGRFVLRRKDGPALDDKALDKYVGKRVTCGGFVVGYSLLADKIDVVR